MNSFVRNPGKVSPEILGKIKFRWEMGDRAEDIAKDLDIHPTTIRHHAKRNSWERGSRRQELMEEVETTQKQIVIANKVERSVQETEKFLQDSERMRMMVLQFQGRILKNRDPNTNELVLEKGEADLIFQYLKCCKISMETLSLAYMGKRKALGMEDSLKEDATILPWED